MSEILRKLLVPLTQLPLAGSLILLWEPAKRKPVYAIVAAAIYEVGVFALAFGKKVWEKLEERAIQQTADWIVAAIRTIGPGFHRRYKSQVIRDHGIFNVRGLGLINTYTLSLDQVFVDLRIDPSNPQKFNIDPLHEKALAGNRQIWDFLRVESIEPIEAAALAIVGPPGCGKTTLLQHVALTFALNRQRRYQLRSFTPILLFLRDHISTITQDKPPSLDKLIDNFFNDSNAFPTLRPPDGWFTRRLRRGKAVVLLDGLDEIAEVDRRKLVSAWVDNQIRNYPRCPFILTARPQGYQNAPLQRAHILEVQPFNARQVRKFIESWYLSNEIMSSGNQNNLSVRERASKDAHNLLDRLRKTPALNALTVNPLLLTMIAMVHRYHGALPGSRVELYADICEVLLGRWRQAKGMNDTLSAAQKLVILRPLATYMMENKSRDITTEEAMEIMVMPLRRVGITGNLAESFLSDLQAHSGLLLERESGQWSFAHLTFQEYLTAAHWLEQKPIQHDWGELVGDSWWHETLRLYAAQGDASGLVRKCLEVDTLPALTLAADCLSEARELDIDLRRDTENRVIDGLNSNDPDRRRLASHVKLGRRLRELHTIDDVREIDLEYLSCAEYQLFLDDMRSQGQYFQPDHWTEFNFPSGHALAPMAGVRGGDAEAFCEWLNRLHGGKAKYRVPEPDEARSYPSKTANLGTWCVEKGEQEPDYTLVGLSESSERSIKQSLIDLFGTTKPLPSVYKMEPTRILSYLHGRSVEGPGDELKYKMDFLAKGLKYALESTSPVELKVGLNNALISATGLNVFVFRQHLNLTLARDLDQSVKLDPKLIKRMPSIRELVFKLAVRISKDFEPVVDGIELNKAQQTTSMIQILENDTNSITSQMASILKIVVSLSNAERIPISVARDAQRTTLIQTLEKTLSPEFLDAWWWLKIVLARGEGKLSAWEGIRIVREQLQEY